MSLVSVGYTIQPTVRAKLNFIYQFIEYVTYHRAEKMVVIYSQKHRLIIQLALDSDSLL